MHVFVDFFDQICKPVMEDGTGPGLLEVAEEVFYESVIPPL